MSITSRIALVVGLLAYLSVIHALNGRIAVHEAAVKAVVERLATDQGVEVEDVVVPPAEEAGVQGHHHAIEDARFYILAINCVLMWIAVVAGLWPLARRALDDGIYSVCESLRLAEGRRNDAEAELEAARQRLAGIDREVEALRERERRAGEDEAAQLREMAALETRRIEEHTESGIRREAELAQERVVRYIAELSIDRAMLEVAVDVDDEIRDNLNRIMVEGFCKG